MAKKDKRAKEAKPTAEKKVSSPANEGFFSRFVYQVIIFTFSFILFANSIPNDYNLDDELVTRNHRLTSKGITAIPEIFKSSYYKDQAGYAYEYRPVVLSTFAIEHSIFGDVPQVSHFINVLLYSLLCVLLFNTLRQLFPAINPLFFLVSTLIFAAHPSHTEVVDNIKCRDEILAFIFSLFALRVTLRFTREVELNKKVLWGVMIAPMFLLALLNKLTIISFAMIIPITVTLFAEANFFEVGFISLCLIIPSLLLVNMNDLFQKVGFGVLLLTVNIFFYGFMNWRMMREFFGDRISFVKPETEGTVKLLAKPGSGFKVLLEGVGIPKGVFSADAIFLTSVLTILYSIGLFLQLKWLFIPSLIILLAFTIFGNKKMSWWATLFFYIGATITLFQFPLGKTIYGDLICLGLSYQIFFGRRSLALPCLLIYFAYAFVNIAWQDNLNTIFYFLFFLSLRHKYTWPLSLLMLGIAVYSPVQYFFLLPLTIISAWSEYYGGAIVVLTFIWMLTKKPLAPLAAVFRSVACLMLLLFQFQFGNYSDKATITSSRAQTISTEISPTIVPGTQNRPLDFIEQPVSKISPLSTRLGTSSEILFHYFYKTILPYPLSFYYGYKFIEPLEPTAPKAIAGLLVIVFLTVVIFWQLNKDLMISYWLIFYLISMLVFSNFLIPVPGLLGDRFMFVPSLAWSVLLVWLVFKFLNVNVEGNSLTLGKVPVFAKYTIAATLLLYSIISFERNFDWQDDITLFSHDNRYVSNSAQANNLLAVHLLLRSNKEKNQAEVIRLRKEATAYFAKAVEIYPNFMNAYFDLGRSNGVLASAAMQSNNQQEANRYLDIAIDAFQNTIRIDSNFTAAYLQLAIVLEQRGNTAFAEKYYKLAIQKQPTNLAAYTNLSYLYFKDKRIEESLSVNHKAHEQMPNAFEPIVNIAKTFLKIDKPDSAFVWMEKAYAMNPKDQNLITTLYETSKRLGYKEKASFYGQQAVTKQ